MTLENLNKANGYARSIEIYSRQLEIIEKGAIVEIRILGECVLMSIEASRDSEHEHATLAAAFIQTLTERLQSKVADLKTKLAEL